jgi:phosphatidylinositol 3-kinase
LKNEEKKITFFAFQEAYKRVAVDSDIVKSIDDNETEESFASKDNVSLNQSQVFSSSVISDKNVSVAQIAHEGDLNATAVSHESDLINTLITDNTPACNLASFLINRACRNPTLSNYLYWYLYIECESQDSIRKQDEKVKAMYEKVLKIFKRTLVAGGPELKQIKQNLEKQQIFIDELVKLVKNVAKESGNRKKKQEKFQQLLSDSDAFRVNFSNFDAIPFPLDPDVVIRGIIPVKVSLFKSALMPSK